MYDESGACGGREDGESGGEIYFVDLVSFCSSHKPALGLPAMRQHHLHLYIRMEKQKTARPNGCHLARDAPRIGTTRTGRRPEMELVERSS